MSRGVVGMLPEAEHVQGGNGDDRSHGLRQVGIQDVQEFPLYLCRVVLCVLDGMVRFGVQVL